MDGLTRTASTTSPSFPLPFPHTPSPSLRFLLPLPRRRAPTFPRLSSSSPSPSPSPSPDPPPGDLDYWDRMELEFGRLMGEDPELTLAKVMARKANPGAASHLEVEQAYGKKKLAMKKGKPLPAEPVEVPLHWDIKRPQLPVELRAPVRPKILDDGGGSSEEKWDPSRPDEVKAGPARLYEGKKPVAEANGKKEGLGIALRRPAHLPGKEAVAKVKARKPSKVDLVVKMRKDGGGERLSDVTLLRKPELVRVSEEKGDGSGGRMKKDEGGERLSDVTLLRKPELVRVSEEKGDGSGGRIKKDEGGENLSGMTLLRKPELVRGSEEKGDGSGGRMGKDEGGEKLSGMSPSRKPELVKVSDEKGDGSGGGSGEKGGLGSVEEGGALLGRKWIEILSKPTHEVGGNNATMGSEAEGSVDDGSSEDDGIEEIHSPEQSFFKFLEDDAATLENWDLKFTQNLATFSSQATPLGESQGSDSPSKKASELDRTEVLNNEVAKDSAYEFLMSSEQEEYEESDWRRAEQLLQTGEIEEVELVSCSIGGFFVSFGSLVGFLPYRNLSMKYKFLAFETWLRRKGLDPSSYRPNLSVIVRGYSIQDEDPSLKANEALEFDKNDEEDVQPGMKFEELLQIYNREKLKFLSYFVGQRIRVHLVLVNRNSRKIVFSGRRIEKKEELARKRHLMAKLNVGDIVKCRVKKLVFYGIFVEVEGATALIHQSEISWDVALDPRLFFKIGQIIDAKVHQLDYDLDRITLSLKETTPDPLSEALESVIGEGSPLGASTESSSGDAEWADVESLVKKLEKVDGITGVSKGRFFLSPGLVPTFQVCMASMYDNRYKLLARFENKVQEVMVESSLDKELMREAILTCTNRFLGTCLPCWLQDIMPE